MWRRSSRRHVSRETKYSDKVIMLKFFRKLKLINDLNVAWLEGLTTYELWDDLDYPLMRRIKDLMDREDALRVEVEKLNDRINGGETGGSIPKLLEQRQLEKVQDLVHKCETLEGKLTEFMCSDSFATRMIKAKNNKLKFGYIQAKKDLKTKKEKK